MIVCVCKRVNTAQIKASLAAGMSIDDISAELGLGTGCGRCLDYATQMIAKESAALIVAA